jgi:holo-[acyl-carrier protein] synthase
MIIGIGTDIVQIPRIEKILGKYADEFPNKILCLEEVSEYHKKASKDKIPFLAKRFAAKEAIAKAFGFGIGQQIKFHDIEISNDDLGKPCAIVKNDIGQDKNILLSISDDYPIAIAFAVISK